MSEKCSSCGAGIEVDELGKFSGTIVKVKKDEKNENVYYCSLCQKKSGNKEAKKEE